MYVLVNTCKDIDGFHAHAVYGPFNSVADAMTARDEMDFPRPEDVKIRIVHGKGE